MKSSSFTKQGDNHWVTMEVRGSYFYISYKPNTVLDVEAAKTIVREAELLADGYVYPAMTNIIQMPSHDKSVRDYFAASASAVANAIIVGNSFSKVVANFFLSLNKPVIPTRIFTDEAKAAKWLEMFPVKKNEVMTL